MISKTKAYLVGGGIGSLAAAAFMVRDGNLPGVQVFWGYALSPDWVGDFVPKRMAVCNGAEILQEIK